MITIEEDVLGRTVSYGNNHLVADVTAFSTRQWLGIVRAVSEDLSTKATLRLADIQSGHRFTVAHIYSPSPFRSSPHAPSIP